jgi:hypothetical protein
MNDRDFTMPLCPFDAQVLILRRASDAGGVFRVISSYGIDVVDEDVVLFADLRCCPEQY